ncbi:hypothetical protein GDO81_021424 [Engystomops pustulosus]|uniref:Cytochrome b n=1 Tax=Engystomops pustulosus TaxID=76066 RepID=A0AAV6ZT84_ENGPU|nr:hypothetical protein GDO81_021424 [Engystomops pustulosus]
MDRKVTLKEYWASIYRHPDLWIDINGLYSL